MEQTKRIYLKDALPRLYADVEAWLQQDALVDMLPQLASMYIANKYCWEADTLDLRVESDNSLYSQLALRPTLYTENVTPNAWVLLCYVETDGGNILTGLECLDDYHDDYIHKQLKALFAS